MGEFVNPLWVTILAWTASGIIVLLNVKYLLDFFGITAWIERLSP
jgi:manganese transport protein